MKMFTGLTVEENIVVQWQYDYFGGFFKSLMQTIQRADLTNLELLSKGFPHHVSAYKKYTTVNGWWTEVDKKFQGILSGGKIKYE